MNGTILVFYNAYGDIHQVGFLGHDRAFIPVQYFTADRQFSNIRIFGGYGTASIEMYSQTRGINVSGELYPTLWLQPSHPTETGWSHIVRHGFATIYYRADGYARIDGIAQDFTLGAGFQHVVSTHWGILFYHVDGRASLTQVTIERTGDSGFGNLVVTGLSASIPVLEIGANWTHVVSTDDYLMFYNASTGDYVVGTITKGNPHTFVPLRTTWEAINNEPAGSRKIESGWTHLVSLEGNQVLLYSQVSGGGQVVQLGKLPWRRAGGLSPIVPYLLTSIMSPVRLYAESTFITATHVTSGYVSNPIW